MTPETWGESEMVDFMASRLYPEGWEPNDAMSTPWPSDNLVVSIDALVESTDVPPGMTLEQAARKAVVYVVSDQASKGIAVDYLAFSLNLPSVYTRTEVDELTRGLQRAREEHGFQYLAADTNEGRELSVTVCGLGRSDREVPTRGGSNVGDILATTGRYGLTKLGLHLLLHDVDPDGETERRAVEEVLEPEARVSEGVAAVSSGHVSSSIDSSDGLARSLHQLSEASGNGLLIEEIPEVEGISKALERRGLVYPEDVLGGGEEFELVFTVPEEGWSDLLSAFEERGLQLMRFGRVVEESGVYLQEDGEATEIPTYGWEHFEDDA